MPTTEATLSRLHADHAMSVYRFAWSVTKDEGLAQEVVQELFLKLARDADVVTAARSERAVIFTIVRNLSLDALQKAAARLPEVEITKPESVIGTNTVRCMQSGIFYGYLGLIEGILTRMKGELPHPVKVLATGGLSSLYGKATSMIDRVELDLTLHGLYLISQRNV